MSSIQPCKFCEKLYDYLEKPSDLNFNIAHFCSKTCEDKSKELFLQTNKNGCRLHWIHPSLNETTKRFYSLESKESRVCLNCNKNYISSGLRELNSDEKLCHDSRHYCSYHCQRSFENKLCISKIKETNKLRYGGTGNASPLLLSKYKETSKERFGTEFNTQSPQFKESMISKYGGIGFASSVLRSKQLETMRSRYGVDYNSQDPELFFKMKSSREITCKKKYGVKHHWMDPKISSKSISTWISKYGIDNPFKSEKVRLKWKDSIKTRLKRLLKLDLGTILSNNSENYLEYIRDLITKVENNAIRLPIQHPLSELKFYYRLISESDIDPIDIVWNYSDPRYPFNCDFYIKSLDLFIELNYSPTHNIKPFNRHDDYCKSEFKRLMTICKSKDWKTFYTYFLYTWVCSDPKKYKVSIENNLNYISLYNKNQEDIFITQLKLSGYRDFIKKFNRYIFIINKIENLNKFL